MARTTSSRDGRSSRSPSPRGPAGRTRAVSWRPVVRDSTTVCGSRASPARPVTRVCAASRSSSGPASRTRPEPSSSRWSQEPSSSATTCEDMTTVVPRSAASAISVAVSWCRARGSRSAIGSSRSSSSGRLPRARASATRVRWPPESARIFVSGSRSPSATIRSAVRASQRRGLRSRPSRRVPAMVSWGCRGLFWATWASRSRAAAGVVPRTVMVPSVGRSSPAARASRVDLPAPFGPVTAQTRPAGSRKAQPSSAGSRRRRNLLPSPAASMAVSVMRPPWILRNACRVRK